MSPQKRGDEYPEKEFSSENGAWADDERFDDDVLDQGNSKVDISGYPLSTPGCGCFGPDGVDGVLQRMNDAI